MPSGRTVFAAARGPTCSTALAAGYAEAGWFPEALAAARKALELAVKQEQRALAEELRAHRTLRKGQALSATAAAVILSGAKNLRR